MAVYAMDWWVMTLGDPYEADGNIIADLLTLILTMTDVSYAVVGNVEGAESYHISEDRGYYRFPIDVLVTLVAKVKRFDWCDILCYRSENEIPDVDFWSVQYPDILSTVDFAVRSVDGGGIEIITNSPRLHEAIVEKYPLEECYYGPLDGYVFMG